MRALPAPFRYLFAVAGGYYVLTLISGIFAHVGLLGLCLWLVVLLGFCYHTGLVPESTAVLCSPLKWLMEPNADSSSASGFSPIRVPVRLKNGRQKVDLQFEAMERINEFQGLGAVREKLRQADNSAKVAAIRGEKNFGSASEGGVIFVFFGPDGTGKSSVAKHFASLLFGNGTLERSSIIEITPSDMNRPGEDSIEVRARESLGGLLLIDDGDWLLRPGPFEDRPRGEIIGRTLGRIARSHPRRLTVLITGSRILGNALIASESWKTDWFSGFYPFAVEFPDLTDDDLIMIFEGNLRDRATLSADGRKAVCAALSLRRKQVGDHFANAREVHVLFDRAIQKASDRMYGPLFESTRPENVPKDIRPEITREDLQQFPSA